MTTIPQSPFDSPDTVRGNSFSDRAIVNIHKDVISSRRVPSRPSSNQRTAISDYIDDTVLADDMVALADDLEALAGQYIEAGDRPEIGLRY